MVACTSIHACINLARVNGLCQILLCIKKCSLSVLSYIIATIRRRQTHNLWLLYYHFIIGDHSDITGFFTHGSKDVEVLVAEKDWSLSHFPKQYKICAGRVANRASPTTINAPFRSSTKYTIYKILSPSCAKFQSPRHCAPRATLSRSYCSLAPQHRRFRINITRARARALRLWAARERVVIDCATAAAADYPISNGLYQRSHTEFLTCFQGAELVVQHITHYIARVWEFILSLNIWRLLRSI